VKRVALIPLVALALVSAQVTPGRAEPLVLGEEELDLVTAGAPGTYLGTLYASDGTTELGTFVVKVNKANKVGGTLIVNGRGKYKLFGQATQNGLGAAVKPRKGISGGFFGVFEALGNGYALSGTWGLQNSQGQILASGVFNGSNSR
jgi:hypothetical protein